MVFCLFLRNDNNAIIHAVYYSDAWYQNEIKEKGGWSLLVALGNPVRGPETGGPQ